MRLPLVSVIIPTYKRPVGILKRAIDSVLLQSYNNLEIIIVDDSPPTYTEREEVENYIISLKDDKIKLIKHLTNQGANVARNTGIDNSSGEFIAFLDDDDEWMISKIEKQIKLMSDENVGLVYCSAEMVTTENQKITKKTIFCAKNRGSIFMKMCEKNHIGSTSSILVRRSVFNILGQFDVELQSGQDYELYLRITNKYEVNYVDGAPLFRYYKHDGERISNNRKNAVQSREYIQNKYLVLLNNNPEAFNAFLIRKSNIYMEDMQYKNSFKTWLRALKLSPLSINRNVVGLTRLFITYLRTR